MLNKLILLPIKAFTFKIFLQTSPQLISMVQIAKTLIFLCMLIGWSQAFPHRDVTSENQAMKDADRVDGEQRDAILNVSTFVCCMCILNCCKMCILTFFSTLSCQFIILLQVSNYYGI